MTTDIAELEKLLKSAREAEAQSVAAMGSINKSAKEYISTMQIRNKQLEDTVGGIKSLCAKVHARASLSIYANLVLTAVNLAVAFFFIWLQS